MTKINIQEITDILSSRTGETKKFSEQFLRELVSVIAEYLQKDGIVKVKGLGTFKIIKVEERKSVDVTTGNEIVLPSHNKVQFTPEDAVKQQVNESYSHLQTTFIDQAKTETKKEKSTWWISIIVLAAIVVALFFTRPYWLHYVENYFGIKPDVVVVDTTSVEVSTNSSVEAFDSAAMLADSTLLMYQDSVSNAEADAFISDENSAKGFDINTYTYKMAAEAPVREYVTVIDGSRLTMVAYRAYGSKDFWVYVYDANRDVLRSPSDVNKGMELKIADLPQELTNPDSEEAIAFARQLGNKY